MTFSFTVVDLNRVFSSITLIIKTCYYFIVFHCRVLVSKPFSWTFEVDRAKVYFSYLCLNTLSKDISCSGKNWGFYSKR